MENSLSLLDPVAFAQAEIQRRVEWELDVAHEIFLARRCVRIHYADLMDSVPEGTASKSMLLAWLRDYPNRPGVITLYAQAHPDHFSDRAWHARYFVPFIRYAAGKLTDPSFVKSRAKAECFARSFADPVWRNKAAAVMGLRLLEAMYSRGALRSREAQHLMSVNVQNRELLEKMSAAIGRIGKGLEHAPMEEIQQLVEEHFKRQWEKAIRYPVYE